MPITSSKTISDPYASLSWNTSVVLLALEKLRLGELTNEREAAALSKVAHELDLLSRASEIDMKHETRAVPPPHLRKSFFTLVAIREKSAPPRKTFAFKQAGEDLQAIHAHLQTHGPQVLKPEVVQRAQAVCEELLNQLNAQRPGGTLL